VDGFAVQGSSPFGAFFTIVVILVLIATWVILATSRFTQGGIVERPERVPQLYGYTVCLIALAIAIVSISGIVGSAFDLTTPTIANDSEFGFEPSVSSFEAYRSTYDRERRLISNGNATVVADTTPERILRQRYEALRNDHVERATVRAHRALLTNSFGLLLAIVFFVIHWRWVRRLGGSNFVLPTT
jgi:amino acid transporter